MKWYKHDANANCDAKLRKVRLKYGMEGYGLYWYCLELIAQNVEKHNLSFELEHDAEIIAADVGIHFELVQEMMTFMVELGLFEQENGIITCLKLARRTDEYTSKIIKQLGSVPILSRQSPDKVRSNRTEQNRLDKKKDNGRSATAFDLFWTGYPKKRKKKAARDIWKRKKLDHIANLLIADVKNRLLQDKRWLNGYVPDPTTYLNGERWNDELESEPTYKPRRPEIVTEEQRQIDREKANRRLAELSAN